MQQQRAEGGAGAAWDRFRPEGPPAPTPVEGVVMDRTAALASLALTAVLLNQLRDALGMDPLPLALLVGRDLDLGAVQNLGQPPQDAP